jgi:hypothetical protein
MREVRLPSALSMDGIGTLADDISQPTVRPMNSTLARFVRKFSACRRLGMIQGDSCRKHVLMNDKPLQVN